MFCPRSIVVCMGRPYLWMSYGFQYKTICAICWGFLRNVWPDILLNVSLSPVWSQWYILFDLSTFLESHSVLQIVLSHSGRLVQYSSDRYWTSKQKTPGSNSDRNTEIKYLVKVKVKQHQSRLSGYSYNVAKLFENFYLDHCRQMYRKINLFYKFAIYRNICCFIYQWYT